MKRRKFVVAGAGIFLSMAFLGRNALKDDKNNESTAVNSKESVENQIVNAIYPDSGQALHHLKLAVKENKVFKSADQEKFKKEILRVFKSSTRQEFITYINKEIQNDFVNEQVLTINEWIFSEFECRFWLVFG
jgi:hypothetical protein